MPRLVVVLVVLAAVLAAPFAVRPAEAAWGSFVLTGSTLLESDPSCAAENTSIVFCAAIGPNSRLVFNRWNGTAWSGWTAAPEIVTAPPNCAGAGTGVVICAARSTSLELIAYMEQLGTLLPSATVKLIIGSAPGCGTLGVGAVLCAARSPSGALVGAYFENGGTWSGAAWTVINAVASKVNSPVTCAPYAGITGDMLCAWVTDGSAIATRVFFVAQQKWSSETDLGGMATNPPVCSSGAVDGTTGCFGTGTDSGLYFNLLSPGVAHVPEWSGWEGLGGLVHGYSCADYSASATAVRYACGVTGLTNSGFWTDESAGGTWTGWAQHGTGAYIGAPSCTTIGPAATRQVMCVVTQQNGEAASIVGP